MNRQELIAQHTKDILALRLDTYEETHSAKLVAEVTAMLSPTAYDRYIREVQVPAIKKHTSSRGFRKLHNDLRDGAFRVMQEEIDAAMGKATEAESV